MTERYRFRRAVPIDRNEITPRTGETMIEAAIWEGRYMVAVAGLVPVAGIGWQPDAHRPGGVRLFGAFEHPRHRGRGLMAALVELAQDASATAVARAQLARAIADSASDPRSPAIVVSLAASRASRAAQPGSTAAA